MSFRKKSNKIEPLFIIEINGSFIIAAYQGSLSKFDILIRYRQKHGIKWSNLRTPKHIHWAVDVIIKMHAQPEKTKEFLNYLLDLWAKTEPFKSEGERQKLLNEKFLIESNKDSFNKYAELSKKGEYSIKFLILLAILLMAQEKTNLPTAYMFKKLISELIEGKDIFRIVSTATHNRR